MVLVGVGSALRAVASATTSGVARYSHARYRPQRSSEVHFHRNLNNTWVAGAVVFAEERAKNLRITRRPRIVGHGEPCVVTEDRASRLTGAVCYVGRSVHAGELGVVEGIEHLKAQLQVTPPLSCDGEVLEDRDVVVVDAGVAQIHARIRPLVIDAGH